MNWRRSEFLSVATFITVAGWIWVASSKNSILEQTREEVAMMQPRVDQNQKDIIELRAINSTQLSMIIRELDSLHKEMHRYRSETQSDFPLKDVAKKD